MDPELVMLAQQGDKRAFEALAIAHHPRLFRVALGVLRDPHLAEDATQQAFVDIWRHLPGLRDPGRFEGWSYRLLVHACYAEVRRRPAVGIPERHVGPGREPIAPDAFAGVVDRDLLERGFRRLSLDHRAVLVLRFLLDMTLEQIAEALDVPQGTVHSRLGRAMAAMRAALEADARSPLPTGPARRTLR